jgi:hypothetical protein
MGGLFNRNNCDSCQPTTCQTTQARTSHFHNNSCNSCQAKIWNWQSNSQACNSCAPATCGDSCGHAHNGIFHRLRGSFGGGSSCCDGGCNSGGCNSSYGSGTMTNPGVPPVKSSEPIVTPPKKLPVEKAPEKVPPPVNPEKKVGSVSIGAPITPTTPNTISVAPSIPSVELAPAPRIEGDRRDPF